MPNPFSNATPGPTLIPSIEVSGTTTVTVQSSDGAQVTASSSIIVPDLAQTEATARASLVGDVLKRNHYTHGNYALASGFNTSVYLTCSGYLQEIYVSIDAKRVSRKLRVELARALYPFPVVLCTRREELNLPIVPPAGSTIGEREYWEMAKERGVYRGEVGTDGKPRNAPEIEYWEEDEVTALEARDGSLFTRCVCC
ncbi:hypothetical protein Hypma_008197 [Hypsizygus marmoreus]|uniref:Uncharacterized protein n=1 Tax=Hypsizygus marmoreus TaxID=39966 RepID=A0A369JRX5_HYPMA|nr:hypothetical protein Hypma_008197 [Hypsizygus marmoreus]